MEITWNDNSDSSIDDKNIISELVHDKKLKLEYIDDKGSKSYDVSPPCDLRILPHNDVKISSVKTNDEESNSKA